MTNIRHNANNKLTKQMMLLLLVFVFGGMMNAAWGQTDYSGVYYLKNNSNNGTYFMYPVNGNEGSYVKTAQNQGIEAVWRLEKSGDYYQIIHCSDGKYLVAEDPTLETNSVKLVSTVSVSESDLFEITRKSGSETDILNQVILFRPKAANNANGHIYLNTRNGNNGSNTIGLWDNSGASEWRLALIPAKPTITVNDNVVSFTAPLGTIHYTTDGTTPTNASPSGSGVTLPHGPRYTVKVKAIYTLGTQQFESEMVSKTVQAPVLAPLMTVSGNTVTITGLQSDVTTFRYTINGNDPTPTTGTLYTESITLTDGNSYVVKAIAYNTVNGTYYPSSVNTVVVNLAPETVIDDLSGITSATGKYKFSSSFTATGTPANNIGTDSNPFSGVLDGDFVEITLANNPLFSCVENATIKNVIISSASVSTTGNAGAIANKVAGDSRIYNCGLLAGTVSGNNYVGGLVGLLDGTSRVINCYSFANVSSANYGSGIVGYNNTSGATQDNYFTKTIVMNCMFYGEITAATKSPVYGGNIIVNNNATGINNYNYFLETATFDNAYTNINQYKNSWPAEERFLTRFEYYRSILNSNRRLCTWWVNGAIGEAPTDEDVATVGIAKWVLDPSIAPYPILKPWGKYPTVINQDPNQVWDETSQEWKSRDNLPAYQGKKLGTLTVTVKAGSNNTNASDKTLVLPILDMDTLHNDYCYAKVQLPYYNEQFGNPDGATHAEKYGNNYTDKVVTGWKINSVTGGTPGSFVEDWQEGYDFANRKCTNKDLYSVSKRVFAQGGYYYVPEGVTAITIEAYWGKAIYLQNGGSYLDRVTLADNPFLPTGTMPTTFNGQPVYNNITTAISQLPKASTGVNVYDQAVVLVSNYQFKNLGSQSNLGWGSGNFASNARPFTWTCVDLDFDNEPDYCLELQYGQKTTRVNIHPVRFDFIPIPNLGLAIKQSSMPFGCGIFIPRGHFEITETAFMHTTQFEYDGHSGYPKETAPLILNGGQYEQIVTTVETSGTISNHTNYIIIGGHAWMKKFTPGSHVDQKSKPTRLCAVSVLGAEFQEFYLTGMFRADISGNLGSPHCYTNGGRFGLMAGAGMEQVNGDVTFKIDHSIVDEFYGGGINSDKPVIGSIFVTIDNSLVGYYCGGPKTGNMLTGTQVITTATKSTFGKFFGGGNGGNNFTRNKQWDNTIDGGHDVNLVPNDWNNNGQFSQFEPFRYVNSGVGYHAQFEFELMNNSGGNNDNVVARTYRWDAQFSMTEVQKVTSTLTDCHVKQEFYGGGNLSPVHGDVVSTLDNTRVDGSAFGAGFSATIPSFSVHDKTTVVYPSRDIAGICHPGSLEYQKDDDVVRLYTWIDDAGLQRLGVSGYNTSNPAFQHDGKWYCYTGVELSNLGTVGGSTTLIIKGNSEIHGSVFGGGDESAVTHNTEVNILGKTKVFGNIYGGGNMGHIGGNTKVIINGQSTGQGTGTNNGSNNH